MTGVIGTSTPQAAPSTYEDLLSLFSQWRQFEQPALREGAPDYTAATLARKHRELKSYQARLRAITAQEATAKLIAWLEQQAPSKSGPSGIGTEDYTWSLRNVHLVPLDERGVITTLQPQFGGKELLLRPREIGVELRYSFQ